MRRWKSHDAYWVRALAVNAMFSTTVLLTGCASFTPDGGMDFVQHQTGSILGKDAVKIRSEDMSAAVQDRVRALLAKTMTVDTAVQIALLNNRNLQVAYNDLGISEAEMVEASLPPAPTIALSRLVATGQIEIERQLLQNVLGLLTLPRRREIAEDRFAQAQVRAVEETLRVAAEARRAYYKAVAAQQSVKFLEDARTSAEAVSELAKKLGETGSMPKLDQAREHAFYAEVSSELAVARLKARMAREKLNRVLGLWGSDTRYRLPDKLMPLPSAPKKQDSIETLAVTSRVDLEVARMELAILAKEYSLTNATRFIDVLDVRGVSRYERKDITEVDYRLDPGPTLVRTETPAKEKAEWHGIDVEFQIPIYDFGEARTRLAEETYMRAVNRLLDKAVNVRADAREAYQTYRGAYDVAKYYDKDILPLRDIISEQTLLNYNGMLTDLFALLTDARARIAANVQAIDAKRDFWLAEADLQAATVGGGMGGAIEGSAPSIASGNPSGG